MKSPWRLVPFLLAAVALGAWWNSLGNEFVWDDRINFSENENIRDLGLVAHSLFSEDYTSVAKERYWRPAVTLSFALEYRLWGLNPGLSRLINIVAHALAAILLFHVLLGLSRSPAPSAAAALLFTAHPITTNAVTQINGRMEVFCALFCLLSLRLLLFARDNAQSRGVFAALSLPALAMGLLSKETALVFPAVSAAALLLFPNGVRRAWTLVLPHFLLCAVCVAFRFLVIGGSALELERATAPAETFLIMLKTVAVYMRLLVYPAGLCADYFSMTTPAGLFSIEAIGCAMLILLAVGTAVFCVKRQPVVSLGILWFLAVILPVMNLIPLLSFVSEKYLYLPCAGACAAFSFTLHAALSRKERLKIVFPLAVIAIAAVFAAGTIRRNRDWKDELTLFAHTAQCSPNSVSAHVKFGNALCGAGRCGEAVGEFAGALRLGGEPSLFSNIGEAFAREGDYKNAAAAFEKYFTAEPRDVNACARLAAALEFAGETQKALATYIKCMDIAGWNPKMNAKIQALEEKLKK